MMYVHYNDHVNVVNPNNKTKEIFLTHLKNLLHMNHFYKIVIQPPKPTKSSSCHDLHLLAQGSEHQGSIYEAKNEQNGEWGHSINT